MNPNEIKKDLEEHISQLCRLIVDTCIPIIKTYAESIWR
jgi:hypothetical protein